MDVRITQCSGAQYQGPLVRFVGEWVVLHDQRLPFHALSVRTSVLDVVGEGDATLARYPFEKNDVVIFNDNGEHIQGRFSRLAPEQGGIVVMVGETLLGVKWRDIIRIQKHDSARARLLSRSPYA